MTAGFQPNSAMGTESLDSSSSDSSSMSTTSERRRENGNREDAEVRALCNERAGVSGGGASSAMMIVGMEVGEKCSCSREG